MTSSVKVDSNQLRSLMDYSSFVHATYDPKVWHKVLYSYKAKCGAMVESTIYTAHSKKLGLCSKCFSSKEKDLIEKKYGKPTLEEYRTPDLMISRNTKTTIVVRVDGVKASDVASIVVNDGNVVVTVEGK